MIKDYLAKKPKPKRRMIQARIPMALVIELQPYMDKNHLSWTTLVEGTLTALCDEIKGKKKI